MKKALLYAFAIVAIGLMITHPLADKPQHNTTNTEQPIDISGVIGQM